MDDPEIQQTALFLWKTAQSLSEKCPAASRYYVSTLNKHFGNSLVVQSFIKSHRYCKYCGSLWSYMNHKIRIHPIPSPNRHIKKLFKLEREEPWKLNNRQKKKLKKYRESTNKIESQYSRGYMPKRSFFSIFFNTTINGSFQSKRATEDPKNTFHPRNKEKCNTTEYIFQQEEEKKRLVSTNFKSRTRS
ncbi:unnamed protein product [Larinioides sclopetarius]|uniref:C2H2-type domain-containing protein n=1 Tax=Larinioides sclopetarius TaxID=280406 RepID=A0AAV2B104_9ARAC